MSATISSLGQAADGHDVFHAKGPRPDEKGNRPLVSLCLIVKNEEARLHTLLDSVAPWVDELVVVDTGSTDGTVAVAEGYGARIFHHPWEDSFSKARNQSLSYARGEWLLIMDADEELDESSGPRLKSTLKEMPEAVGVIYFKLYNHLPGNQGSWALQPRMFRNLNGFCYRGSVHNEADLPGRPFKSDLTVIHYGYDLDPETMAAKHQRRLRMIRSWIEEEPDKLAPHAYLAQTLLSDHSEQARLEAVDEAKKALHLAKTKGHPDVDFPRCYYPLIVSLHYLGRDEETEKYCLECAGKTPYYSDPFHFLSFLAMKKGDLENTRLWARRFMETQDWAESHPETFRYIEIMTVAQKGQNLYRWSLAAAMLGHAEESLAAFERLVVEIGEERWVRTSLQDFLANDLAETAEKATELALSARPEWDWLGYYREVTRAGAREKTAAGLRDEAAKALAENDRSRALELMRRVLELSPEDGLGLVRAAELVLEDDPDQALIWLIKGLSARVGGAGQWNLLGDLLFERGDNRGAVAAYRRGLAMEPGRAPARLKTAGRRLRERPEPVVGQKLPGMVIFLASGLSRDLVGPAAPGFLMGRAWGGLAGDTADGAIRNLTHWATLFTGRGPKHHGLLDQNDQRLETTIADLPLATLWDVVGAGKQPGPHGRALVRAAFGAEGLVRRRSAPRPFGAEARGSTLFGAGAFGRRLQAGLSGEPLPGACVRPRTHGKQGLRGRVLRGGKGQVPGGASDAGGGCFGPGISFSGPHASPSGLGWRPHVRRIPAVLRLGGRGAGSPEPRRFCDPEPEGLFQGLQAAGRGCVLLPVLAFGRKNGKADPVEVAPRILERLGLDAGELGRPPHGAPACGGFVIL